MTDTSYYDLLGVPPDASAAVIKRAFRQRALAVHPDRNSAKDANEAFTWLKHVQEVLLDPDKRALYDEHGSSAVEEGDDGDAVDAAFWASSAAVVTPEDISAYEKKYPKSDDEKEDLEEFYTRFDGKVDAVLMYIPFSEEEDLSRFLELWDELIADGTIEDTAAYKKSKKKLATKISSLSKKKGGKKGKKAGSQASGSASKDTGASGDMTDLVALIQGRAKQRKEDFDAMAESISRPSKRRRS